MVDKLKVAIIFGGRSAEHEVSLQSAKSVIEALDKDKFEPVLIGIDKSGRWMLQDQANYLLNEHDPKLIALNKSNKEIMVVPTEGAGELVSIKETENHGQIDVVFPIMHGTYGEDGAMQGFLKLANLPFVGCDLTSSAICMDKDFTKRLLKLARIPVAKLLVFRRSDSIRFDQISSELGLPFFVKAANLGSSVSVSKVHNEAEFEPAIKEAFLYDNKILIEQHANGRELECAVMGNNQPVASKVGEVIPSHEFYSYEAKYIDENGAKLEIPAKISPELEKKVQNLAIKTFKTLGCEGMARVDFFLKAKGEVLVNEVNTIPGFTKISMYPKLWEISGISYKELVTKLIELAIERYERDSQKKTNYQL
jgi:D-alanine-D-alanine ligase